MATLKLNFDLAKLIQEVEPDRKRRVAFTPYLSNDSLKREFGRRMVDTIIERTLDGKDKSGKAFKKYAKSYKESLAFKIYGKSNSVNLKLTGEMQSAIDVIKVGKTTVTIGFVDDNEELKALGHVNGANYLPVRDFWGVSPEDQYTALKSIIKDIEAEVEISELIEERPNLEITTDENGTRVTIEEDDEL
jgi:hypothetical protein